MSQPADDVRAKRELLQQLLNEGKRQTEPAAPPRQVATPVASAPVAMPREPLSRPAAPRRVASRPSSQRHPFDTSVISHERVDQVAVNTVRVLAFVILIASFFGSVLAFDGNWTPSWRFWQGITPIAALVGIGLQLEITLVEWWRGARWHDPVYLFHLLLDSVLTFLGFWPLLGQPLIHALQLIVVTILATSPPQWALEIAARTAFSVACVLAARLPERWLVGKPKHEVAYA